MSSSATADRLKQRLEDPAFVATDKQTTFIDAVLSGEYLYLALGGGIRGTKTWAILSVFILLCRIYPGSRWAIVRKDLPTLRRNTIPSIEKIRLLCAGFLGELNQGTWTYTCSNGSQILLFPESFSTDPDYDRWKGLEVNGFALEEANEMTEGAANKAIERAGSWIIPSTKEHPSPEQPPPYVLFTFNPCANWPRLWFYEPHAAGTLQAPYYYLPATAADNPYVPDAVREAWKNLPDEEYERFIEGSWDFIADPDQLIPLEWIRAARYTEPQVRKIQGMLVRPPSMNRLAIDPARFGDDESVFCRTKGNRLVDLQAFKKMSTTRQGEIGLLTARMKEFPVNAEDVRIDTVGLGAGVADTMVAGGMIALTEVVAGGKPWPRTKSLDGSPSFYTFKNVRSQMWWEGREKFRLGYEFPDHPMAIQFPEELEPKLVADLTAMKYKISADRVIEVWPKDKAKEILGRSTDYADAFLQAILDAADFGTVSFSNAAM